MKPQALALSILFSLLLISSPSWGGLSDRSLKIGLIEYNPLVGFDGKGPDGPLFEYAQPILARAGLPLNFQQVSIDRSIEQLKSGQLDIVLTLFKTSERERHVRYSRIPLLIVNPGFCTQQDIEKTPLTTRSRLGHYRGTIVPPALKSLEPYPVTGAKIQSRMLQMLHRGRVDAIFSPKPEVFILTAYLTNTAPPQYCYELRDSRVAIYLGFSRELPEEIVHRIEESLESRVTEEGFDRYLKRRLEDFGMKAPSITLVDSVQLPSRAKP